MSYTLYQGKLIKLIMLNSMKVNAKIPTNQANQEFINYDEHFPLTHCGPFKTHSLKFG